MMKIFVISGLLLLAAKPASDSEIQAGKRIGRVEIGASVDAVHAGLGKPTGSYKVAEDVAAEYWTSGYQTVRIFLRSAKVIQVSVTSPSFRSPQGISTKSSTKDFERTAGKITTVQLSAPHAVLVRYLDDVDAGIAFELTGGNLEGVEPQLKPFAILVHVPGARAIPEPDEE